MTERYTEPSRDLPVVESADVVVCGGVPAGVAAAIAAETDRPPHEVPFDEVRRGILDLGPTQRRDADAASPSAVPR